MARPLVWTSKTRPGWHSRYRRPTSWSACCRGTLHPVIARLCLTHRKHLVTRLLCQGRDAGPRCASQGNGAWSFSTRLGWIRAWTICQPCRSSTRFNKRVGASTASSPIAGGLPALESNNNPLGYKFSWSPEGAMLAATNDGRYMEHGKVIDVPGDELFKHYWLKSVPGAGVFEAYVNRDALP